MKWYEVSWRHWVQKDTCEGAWSVIRFMRCYEVRWGFMEVHQVSFLFMMRCHQISGSAVKFHEVLLSVVKPPWGFIWIECRDVLLFMRFHHVVFELQDQLYLATFEGNHETIGACYWTVCVLHIKLAFPPSTSSTTTECSCQYLLLGRRALWSQKTRQRYTSQTKLGDLAMTCQTQ